MTLKADLRSQTYEFCKTIGGEYLESITPLPDESGYIAKSNNSSIVKIDRSGEIIWSYFPLTSFSGFTKAINLKYKLLSNGSIFISFGNFECDICIGSGIVMIDGNGNEIWANKLINERFGDCSFPVFSVISGDGNILGFGRDSLWNISLDGTVLGRKKYANGGSNFFIWGNEGHIYLRKGEQLYLISEEGEKMDSLSLYPNFIKAIPIDSGRSALMFKSELIFLKDFEFNSHSISYIDPVRFLDVYIKNDDVYIAAKEGDNHLLIHTNQECTFEFQRYWGTEALTVTGFAATGNQIIVSGTEKGADEPKIPFIKTFRDDLNSFQSVRYDAQIIGIEADSAFGKVVETQIPPDSSVVFTSANWTIKNIKINIYNSGFEPISEITLNTKGYYQYGCEEKQIITSRKFAIDINPGQSAFVVWGDKTILDEFANELPLSSDLCFWVTSPNEKLDADNSNDKECTSIPIRNTTAVEDFLSPATVEIYPNPASDFLILKLKNELLLNAETKIFDAFGKEVFYEKNAARKTYNQLNVNHLPVGVYFLRFKTNQGFLVKKWIKN